LTYIRYIKRRGKLYGPYYYKSVRTPEGKVRNIYLGTRLRETNGKRWVRDALAGLRKL